MSDPKTARRGVVAGVGGMALAVVGTLLQPEIIALSVDRDRPWSSARVIGVPLSRVAADRGAAADRALARLRRPGRRPGRHREVFRCGFAEGELTAFRMGAIALEVILGFLTFTGSLDGGRQAAGGDPAPGRSPTAGQNFINLALLGDRRCWPVSVS